MCKTCRISRKHSRRRNMTCMTYTQVSRVSEKCCDSSCSRSKRNHPKRQHLNFHRIVSARKIQLLCRKALQTASLKYYCHHVQITPPNLTFPLMWQDVQCRASKHRATVTTTVTQCCPLPTLSKFNCRQLKHLTYNVPPHTSSGNRLRVWEFRFVIDQFSALEFLRSLQSKNRIWHKNRYSCIFQKSKRRFSWKCACVWLYFAYVERRFLIE